MNWLRCKARADRWKEELKLVEHEMMWTVSYFDFWVDRWERLWRVRRGRGHKVYAQRSKAMWAALRDNASSAFQAARDPVAA